MKNAGDPMCPSQIALLVPLVVERPAILGQICQRQSLPLQAEKSRNSYNCKFPRLHATPMGSFQASKKQHPKLQSSKALKAPSIPCVLPPTVNDLLHQLRGSGTKESWIMQSLSHQEDGAQKAAPPIQDLALRVRQSCSALPQVSEPL